ncbi:unnamed protein product [Clonostachys rosea]|uniref:Cytochrome b5 heme-binding domain-containing protein n=1 Tax=Bionectria ochroleuca TaxID=29856 RepID=A0ABY6TXN5_BIOOC|nr:unnamed protein product [Clonostachys rosea]
MSGKFEPKAPVTLDPPKDDPISLEELAKANGKSVWVQMSPCAEGQKCYVAIKACDLLLVLHRIDPPSLSLIALPNCPGRRQSNMVSIQGKVYDVTGKAAYQPGNSYHVFAGKDASRALGKSSVKPEDVSADWKDLSDSEKKVLDDWVTFFSKRYNIVGRVEGATNTE